MKLKTKLLILLSVFVFLFTSCKDSEDARTIELKKIESGVQSLVDARSGVNKIPGITVSVFLSDGNQIDVAGGVSDADVKVTSEMRFGLASITKTAVAATVLKLESEGLLSIQDPISKWLNLGLPNISNSITIHQLLNHQAGLLDYFAHPDVWPTVEGNLEKAITPTELAGFIGPPVFTPGAKFEYSNSNYIILGLIIEKVTGKKVSAVMREKFWQPLQLNSFYFGPEEEPTGTVASPWRDTNGDKALENISSQFKAAYHSVFYTAADVFTTAHDLARWAKELYAEDGNALSESSRQKMLNFYPVAGQEDWDGYGLGVRRFKISGREYWGHSGGMRGYTTNMIWDPEKKFSVVILTNQSLAPNGGVLIREILTGTLALLTNE